MSSLNKKVPRIAVFASGAGSNANEIARYFADRSIAEIALIVCNKPGAGVYQVAENHGIPTLTIAREQFLKGDAYVPDLQAAGIDFIVLAGFLWKVPMTLIRAFSNKIINIHPALLPNYGGKGMYGHFVHEAVIQNKEKESGITIHYVDEHYDHGSTIFQATCQIDEFDTPATLAQKIHLLEHAHFAPTIEKLVNAL